MLDSPGRLCFVLSLRYSVRWNPVGWLGQVVSRFTFHIVWLLIFAGFALTLHGGPYWSYPIALLLSLIGAAFVTAYPMDNSLRRTLGCFGALLTFFASTRFIAEGLTPLVLNESSSVLLVGAACLWSAIFPHRDASNVSS